MGWLTVNRVPLRRSVYYIALYSIPRTPFFPHNGEKILEAEVSTLTIVRFNETTLQKCAMTYSTLRLYAHTMTAGARLDSGMLNIRHFSNEKNS